MNDRDTKIKQLTKSLDTIIRRKYECLSENTLEYVKAYAREMYHNPDNADEWLNTQLLSASHTLESAYDYKIKCYINQLNELVKEEQ